MSGGSITPILGYFRPKVIYSEDLRSIGTFTTPIMDLSLYRKAAIKIKSTLDQTVTLQLIGDFFTPMDIPTNINGVINLPAGSVTPSSSEVGLAPDDWQPYAAMQITIAAPPTTGTIQVWVSGQS